MNTVQVVPLFSKAFQDVSTYIATISAPYTLEDIEGFNGRYKRAYHALSREEKRRIETFVDTMIRDVAKQEWASKIFGVV